MGGGSSRDPLVLLAVTVLLGVVAVIACAGPRVGGDSGSDDGAAVREDRSIFITVFFRL